MANTQTRSSGLFTGLVLLSVGILLLLHNYGQLDLGEFFTRWWPLLIIFWGAVKLYERTIGQRFGGSGGAITGGEVFLVFAMLALLGIVVGVEYVEGRIGHKIGELSGDNYSFDADVAPKTIPAKAPVLIRTSQGDITVRASEDSEIHVSAKKMVRGHSETQADRVAQSIGVAISQNGTGYEVHTAGFDPSNKRIGMDMEVTVPRHSPLSIRTDKGDVSVSDMDGGVSVYDKDGDIEVRTTSGDVSLELYKGDAKVADTKGDVRLSGKGGEVEVNGATGSLRIEGDFYGPVRADRVDKGVRVVSGKTDLTVSALAGHLEASSGELELVDAGGNVDMRTRDTEVSVENPGGKLNIENRNAQTSVRFSRSLKEDVQITNSSGGISLTLPGSASFEIQADCRNCDIESEFSSLSATKSESGDSHLAGKYGSGKGPKIVLKTSYGNIELQRSAVEAPAAHPGAPPPHEVPPATEQ
jgi:DUF4097 and DUF4098 domain-containing protein YvlB